MLVSRGIGLGDQCLGEEITMKAKKTSRTYSTRPVHRYAYPNAAEPGYFLNKFLDAVTITVSGLGLIVTLMFMATM